MHYYCRHVVHGRAEGTGGEGGGAICLAFSSLVPEIYVVYVCYKYPPSLLVKLQQTLRLVVIEKRESRSSRSAADSRMQHNSMRIVNCTHVLFICRL